MTTLMTLQVNDKQMKKYTDLIYKTTGIEISLQKKQLLSNRIRRRLKATGIECFDKYYNHLNKLTLADAEWDGFLQEVTTHETYLFRDENHWNWLRKEYLPEMVKQARLKERAKSLRVWSAACSTGDEAHSISCCIQEALGLQKDWTIQILGTDIGIGAVEKAQEGVFNQRAMKLVPPAMKKKYFNKLGNADIWEAKPVIKKGMQFKQHNLLNALRENPFDLVFLKNVLIYFNRESKAEVCKLIEKNMKPGSYLVAGGAEGITEFLGNFNRIQSWLFQKK